MREHLVAECETRHLLADRGDDTCRFDAKCQRWLSADVPIAHADDLVPVADPCGAYRDHQLVRRGRSRRRELEHAHVAAERIDPGGSHPTHRVGSLSHVAPTNTRQEARSQPSSPSDQSTAMPRLKISSSSSLPDQIPILSLSG